MKTIRKVAVVGGGTMGRQIALNAAISGYETKVTDTIPAVRENVRKWAEDYLAGRIAKGRMTAEQVDEIRTRFSVADSTEEAVFCVVVPVQADSIPTVTAARPAITHFTVVFIIAVISIPKDYLLSAITIIL